MSEWDFTNYESRTNLLRTVRRQSDEMFVLGSPPEAWEAPTALGRINGGTARVDARLAQRFGNLFFRI